MSDQQPDFIKHGLTHFIVTTDGTTEGTHVDMIRGAPDPSPQRLGGIVAVHWKDGGVEIPDALDEDVITIKVRGVVRQAEPPDGR